MAQKTEIYNPNDHSAQLPMMQVYQSLETYQKGNRTVATIGTFDGVHLGHKVILDRLKAAAQEENGESLVLTFHPHPRLILFPENNPLKLLQTLDEKITLMESMGIDKLLVVPFSKDFSRIPSKAFIRDILIETVGIQKIIIGYDHRFGKNRTGGVEELTELAKEGRYSVEEIPAQTIDNANISSTKIRKALMEGDIAAANLYLGYPYTFAGEVIHGEKQGRKLGFPTANIQPDDPGKLIPADGIYFVKVLLEGEKHWGLMSIGKKPTMGEFERSQEVWIYNFDRDIYGKNIRVEMLEWMRGEEKFDSLDALIHAMNRDKQKGEERIRKYENL
ncbi:MAG: bifunctional riboflavin kinase/FAD synthetase [Bacteroidia bacterium]|nr:bifunctional riboflavin kinase/FAD synthetase [Bacteroidia bacterium]